MILRLLIDWLRPMITGRKLERSIRQNQIAADKLDAAVREVLRK